MRDSIKRPTKPTQRALAADAHARAQLLKSLLTTLRTHDVYTYSHSVRTVTLTLLLGRACGLPPTQMRALCLGALLHDVGKINVPEAVLHKPGSLTDEEWLTMRRHPQDGARFVRGVAPAQTALRVITEHHERWDGAGYPARLRGEEIALHARIVAVADAFDAMTSARAYRPPRTCAAAMAELARCAGTQFDPRVVAAFHSVPRARIEGAMHRDVRRDSGL